MKNLTKQKMNNQKGFTLIELVVVIVILGILAVTAAPKFIDLQDEAREATLDAVKASMQSAATLVHSKSLIEGNETSTGAATVNVNSVPVFVRYGYPRDNAAGLVNWEDDLLDLIDTEFTMLLGNGGIIIHRTDTILTGSWPAIPTAPVAGERNCYVHYRESDVLGDKPLIIDVVPCL